VSLNYIGTVVYLTMLLSQLASIVLKQPYYNKYWWGNKQ